MTLEDKRKVLVQARKPGKKLSELIDTGVISSPRDLGAYESAVTRALDKLHDKGIEHNDISDGNVLFTPRKWVEMYKGRVKAHLIDYGRSMLVSRNKVDVRRDELGKVSMIGLGRESLLKRVSDERQGEGDSRGEEEKGKEGDKERQERQEEEMEETEGMRQSAQFYRSMSSKNSRSSV